MRTRQTGRTRRTRTGSSGPGGAASRTAAGGRGIGSLASSVEPDFRSPYSGTGFPSRERARVSARLDRACPRRPGLADAPLLLLSESSLFLTGLRSQPRRRISWRCPPGRTAASSALNPPPPTPPNLNGLRVAPLMDACKPLPLFLAALLHAKAVECFHRRTSPPGWPRPLPSVSSSTTPPPLDFL